MTPQTDEVTHCSGNSNIESQCSMLEDSTNKSLVSIVDINCLLAEDLLEPPTDAHHGNGAAVTGGAVVEEGVHIMETLLIDMYDSAKLHLVKLLLKTDLLRLPLLLRNTFM